MPSAAALPIQVLLVDDDEEDFLIARDLMARITTRAYELDWIDNFEQGLVTIKEQRHQIYLLDYHLGAYDGLELLRRVLESGCQAPIIMLTGQGGRHVDVEAMSLGAYDYLVKGQITPELLERSMRYALQHARSTNALRDTVRISGALLTVLSHLDVGVAITDPLLEDSPLIYVNDSYVKMTGYSRRDLLGRNPRFLQGEETSPQELRRVAELLSTGQPYLGDLLNYRQDGSTFVNRMAIHPVFNSQGQVVQYVALCEPLPDA